jgi:carbohydrate diacid regulator
MIKLTERLAQDIVDKMMEVVPYNVNIMNSEGVIIGSGDRNRIGKLHEGALKAINSGTLIAVHEIQGGAKPGINMPIYFNNKIMGVIGISGEPDTVTQFASIVKITAELLISQEYLFNERRINERVRDEFLYQWAYAESYDEHFNERAAALGIDVTIERVSVIVKLDNKRNIKEKIERHLKEAEYSIRLNPETVCIFMKNTSKLRNRVLLLHEELGRNIKIGIGSEGKIMAQSLREGIKAIEIADRIHLVRSIYDYEEIAFIDNLTSHLDKKGLSAIAEKLEEAKGMDLINTLMTYVTLDGNVGAVTEALHIHRNSLNYRLKRIEEITGKDPRRLMDLLELFSAVLIHKLK